MKEKFLRNFPIKLNLLHDCGAFPKDRILIHDDGQSYFKSNLNTV
jgi:hypothetical protein